MPIVSNLPTVRTIFSEHYSKKYILSSFLLQWIPLMEPTSFLIPLIIEVSINEKITKVTYNLLILSITSLSLQR